LEKRKITYPCRESKYGFSVPHPVARTNKDLKVIS
jgi:hypothetical protein